MTPTETLAKLLKESNVVEMVFRHSDIHPIFVKLTTERNEALSESSRAWGLNASLNVQIALMGGVRTQIEQERDQLRAALATESKQAEWYRQQVIEGDKIIEATEAELIKAQASIPTERTARESLTKERDGLAAALVLERRANLGLRLYIHRSGGHNQWFERCESLWCNFTSEPQSRDLALEISFSDLSATFVATRLNPHNSADILAAHDALLTEPLERRVGELEEALIGISNERFTNAPSYAVKIREIAASALASTPREGTEGTKS